MGSVHARGDTFLTFGLKALTETNTSRLATDLDTETVGWNPAQGMDVYFRLSIIIIHLSPYHHSLVTAKML
jgi:hypothetical protein